MARPQAYVETSALISFLDRSDSYQADAATEDPLVLVDGSASRASGVSLVIHETE